MGPRISADRYHRSFGKRKRRQSRGRSQGVSLDWAPVRESIKKYGMRNSNTMAIAPTATISNITAARNRSNRCTNICLSNQISRENLQSPIFTSSNSLKNSDLWDQQMLDDLKYFDGSIAEIERIPQEIKQVFLHSV